MPSLVLQMDRGGMIPLQNVRVKRNGMHFAKFEVNGKDPTMVLRIFLCVLLSSNKEWNGTWRCYRSCSCGEHWAKRFVWRKIKWPMADCPNLTLGTWNRSLEVGIPNSRANSEGSRNKNHKRTLAELYLQCRTYGNSLPRMHR